MFINFAELFFQMKCVYSTDARKAQKIIGDTVVGPRYLFWPPNLPSMRKRRLGVRTSQFGIITEKKTAHFDSLTELA